MNGFATLLFEDLIDIDGFNELHAIRTPIRTPPPELPKSGPVADLEAITAQRDIDLVVAQTNVSRLIAVETLIKYDGCIVNAICDLTNTNGDDLKTVMQHGFVSREVAIKALKKVNGDPVMAVLNLTM